MVWSVGKGDPYALLAALLGRERGVAHMPPMARRERGKPWFPDRADLCFNVSHSGEWALCALGEQEVGADIERVRPRSAGLPRYALGPGEYEWFARRGERWEDFYTLWTLKEARVKCSGEGLGPRASRDIEVPLLEPGEVGEMGPFRFFALGGPGWRGAVCGSILEKKG